MLQYVWPLQLSDFNSYWHYLQSVGNYALNDLQIQLLTHQRINSSLRDFSEREVSALSCVLIRTSQSKYFPQLQSTLKPKQKSNGYSFIWMLSMKQMEERIQVMPSCICPNVLYSPRLSKDLRTWIMPEMCCPAVPKCDGMREEELILHNWLLNLFGSAELQPD